MYTKTSDVLKTMKSSGGICTLSLMSIVCLLTHTDTRLFWKECFVYGVQIYSGSSDSFRESRSEFASRKLLHTEDSGSLPTRGNVLCLRLYPTTTVSLTPEEKEGRLRLKDGTWGTSTEEE